MTRAFLILVVLAAACSSSATTDFGRSGSDIARLDAALPKTFLGLEVSQEADVGSLDGLGDTYVESNALFSMRADDLVQATLQITRLTNDAPNDDSFRSTVVSRIGSTQPTPYLIDEQTIHLTTGTKQTLAIWFTERDFFVLNIRDDFPRPRSLIRASLALRP